MPMFYYFYGARRAYITFWVRAQPAKKTASGEAAKVCKWGRDSGPDRRFLQNAKIHLSPQILDLFVAILA